MKKILFILAISSLIGMGFTLIGFSYLQDPIFHGFTIVGICILLGIAVKSMDLLIDEIKAKSYRIWVIPLAIFIPTAMVYLALTEEPVVGMVIGTVIGILIAGKLDHPAYVASAILFIALIFIAFLLEIISIELTTIYIIPVAATGSFLDEFGHERWKVNNRTITFMFKHRFFLKAFAFLGVVAGFAQPIHLIGFLCFDVFYDLTETAYRYDDIGKKLISHSSQPRLNKEVKDA